ncbi:MAG TPA: class I SAM-dependent methyltransferase [Bacteroidales bacterium]|nr:class I SAM-dependent methyltransferase [Bacteroidales bacterium]
MSIISSAAYYLLHRLKAISCSRSHPHALDFIQHVVNDKTGYPDYRIISRVRSRLLMDTTLLNRSDFGAGSRKTVKNITIGDYAKRVSVNEKYGQLLYRICRFYRPGLVLELGTALGLSTLYLALGNREARVITVESNPQLAGLAEIEFCTAGLENIILINSRFEDVLPDLPEVTNERVLVFIDGNHRLESTVAYYNLISKKWGKGCIIIFDDINWSGEMRLAWKRIKDLTNNAFTADLFYMGIIFSDEGMSGQNFHVRY